MSQPLQELPQSQRTTSSPETMDANGAVDWKKLCEDLTAERDQLRKELFEVKEDRDAYLRAVKALLPEKQYSFTKEELFSQVCQNPSLDDLIAELERDGGE
jgi:hypothetical protein